MKNSRAFLLVFLLCLAPGIDWCRAYDPYRPDTANKIGVWAFNNDNSRKADEEPIERRLTIYATHMEYCPGQGTFGTEGEWKDGSFWCDAKDGSGKIEAAKVIADDQIQVHVAAFVAGSKDVVTLYKVMSDDEKKALAAKNSQPVVYPPPQGTIKVGMTEYELLSLPWKSDSVTPLQGDNKDTDAAVYSYHSDNPQLVDLKVTVRDHKVIAIGGGNG